MIGINKTPQFVLTILMVIFAVLLVALQSVRFSETANNKKDLPLWICEFLAALVLIGIVVTLFFSYWKFIPANSPGCLPFVSDFGVVASAVDPSAYAIKPPASYPALSYTTAIDVYRKSPNGLATGYFAWDGIAVVILNSEASQLKSGAPKGTSWVFQDLSTASSSTS